MTRIVDPVVSPMSWSAQMCGWLSAATASASRRNRWRGPVGRDLSRQDLDGHGAVQSCVTRPVDLSHATRAEFLGDFIGAESPTRFNDIGGPSRIIAARTGPALGGLDQPMRQTSVIPDRGSARASPDPGFAGQLRRRPRHHQAELPPLSAICDHVQRPRFLHGRSASRHIFDSGDRSACSRYVTTAESSARRTPCGLVPGFNDTGHDRPADEGGRASPEPVVLGTYRTRDFRGAPSREYAQEHPARPITTPHAAR